ncbi:MAG: MFS transporter [Pseudomonadota bacterium]
MTTQSESAVQVVPLVAVAAPIIASIAFVLELTIVPVLLAEIRDSLSLDTTSLSWVFNAYAIAVAVGVLAGGWLGDTLQASRVFQLGVALFAVGAGLVALSTDYQTLLIGRVVQGLGGGFFSPLVPILLTKARPEFPGKILIIWGATTGYVAAVAPLLGAPLASLVGWNSMFFVFVAFAILALAMSSIKSNFVEFEAPCLPNIRSLMRSNQLWVVFGFVFCSYGCITYFLFSLPLMLAGNGFSTELIGICLCLLWLNFAVISMLLRNIVDGKHLNTVLLSGPVLILLGFVAAYSSNHLVAQFAAAVLLGAGFACSNAPSTQLVLRIAPADLRACSASLDITFARLGGVATVALFAGLAPSLALWGIALLCFAAFVFGWLSLRQKLTDGAVPE